jgi:hypothetical protein
MSEQNTWAGNAPRGAPAAANTRAAASKSGRRRDAQDKSSSIKRLRHHSMSQRQVSWTPLPVAMF